MYTYDDALFAVLHSCKDTISSARLVCYIYMNEIAGLDYQFRYQMVSSGVKARGIDSYVGYLINIEFVKLTNGNLVLTDLGREKYESIPMMLSEWDKFNQIKKCLDSLSDTELTFVVLTDIIVKDVLARYGVKGLVSKKDYIKNMLSNLSREYSEENFDSALKLLRCVKEGFDED